MRILERIFGLVGVLAIVSVVLIETGNWRENWWLPRIKREIISIQMASEGGAPVITGVCNPGAEWSPRKRGEVVGDIRHDGMQYFLKCKDSGKSAKVMVHYHEESNKWFIRTQKDSPCKFGDPDIPKNCMQSVN